MTKDQLTTLCLEKEQELLHRYFGRLVREAAIERPETIGPYTRDLPLKIEAEYREFLEGLWREHTPEGQGGAPLVLDEQQLRMLLTDDDREAIDEAYRDASTVTWWEKLTRSNHEDVTYYKALLQEYTRDLLMVMRNDFLEEITGRFIRNKVFEKD